MFVELAPLLKDRTVLITVASIDGKLKVNLIPTKAKGRRRRGFDHASQLYRLRRRIGCRTWRPSRQLRAVAPGVAQYVWRRRRQRWMRQPKPRARR